MGAPGVRKESTPPMPVPTEFVAQATEGSVRPKDSPNVAAFRSERYLRLGGLFLLAVGIHGSWNALALLQGFGELFPTNRLGSFEGAASFAWIGLVVLLAVSLGVLIIGNRRIRARQEAEEAELAATPPAPTSFDPYASI